MEPVEDFLSVLPRLLPFSASVNSEAEATEIAQPAPMKRASLSRCRFSSFNWTVIRSPAQRVEAFDALALASSSGPKLPRLPAMVDDDSADKRSSINRKSPASLWPDRAPAHRPSSRRIVESEGRARGGGDAKAIHQRLRAVVAGADRDSQLVENSPNVVRVNSFEDEGDHRGFVASRCR